ncbi:hypothetical protein GCM10023328_31350 [Modestobacter marinus]|uniref:Gram-positive cocci surface proteins LPxTG domain-containing protein n=1 Tax=Modestobacter marinus TaxID=477641 RepID=A0A846M0G6_9ACTN|nr:hypothetical protein [Modestobacter marinus]NIH68040.1 hypothetical protein [Modestobacter marinus]GGL69280.1 hypothetical protein GCM10011589_27010 [Modestobacter marinus]
MSRLTRTRAAVATGLTLGTATAGLLFAPAALAAPAAPTVSPSSTVAPGTEYSVSGVGCTPGAASTVVSMVPDVEHPQSGDGTTPAADGSWKIDMTAPTELGSYSYRLTCDQYTTKFSYGTVTITVTADGKPVPPATPAAFVPGAKPNTPGIAVASSTGATNVAAPGQKVTKTYKGFKAHEKVTLVLHSTPVTLGTFTADANGVVTASFTLPAGTALGTHTLAFDGDAGSHFEETLTLTADGKALAYTGASVTLPLVGGAVLVTAGAGALVLGRRRNAGAAQA